MCQEADDDEKGRAAKTLNQNIPQNTFNSDIQQTPNQGYKLRDKSSVFNLRTKR